MRRRLVLQSASGCAAALILGTTPLARSEETEAQAKEIWLRELFAKQRASDDPLLIGKFRDALYYLVAPITWKPNPDQVSRFQSVTVPVGFVTDLASIPGVFYRILPPDAEYAYAAVIHDYLYWVQDRPRDTADDIFGMAMKDFSVSAVKIRTLVEGVRKFGQSAWDENARLKRGGEKRVLKKLPPHARFTWDEWRSRPEAFN